MTISDRANKGWKCSKIMEIKKRAGEIMLLGLVRGKKVRVERLVCPCRLNHASPIVTFSFVVYIYIYTRIYVVYTSAVTPSRAFSVYMRSYRQLGNAVSCWFPHNSLIVTRSLSPSCSTPNTNTLLPLSLKFFLSPLKTSMCTFPSFQLSLMKKSTAFDEAFFPNISRKWALV